MLEAQGFDWRGVPLHTFTNPATGRESGIILPHELDDLVLILLPGLGTGISDHQERFEGTVRYLGSVVEGDSPPLKHKYQNDPSYTRDESKDVVHDRAVGETFETPRGVGRLYGYHNMDSANPVALRIRAKRQ